MNPVFSTSGGAAPRFSPYTVPAATHLRAMPVYSVQSADSRANPLDTLPSRLGLRHDPVGTRYRPRNLTNIPSPNYPLLGPSHGPHSFELEGIQLYRSGNEPLDEIFNNTGGIFLRTLHAKNTERLVMPFTGSGLYPALARSTAFAGEIVLNEPDPLIASMLQRLLNNPEVIVDGVSRILDELRGLCLKYGVVLDEKFRFDWSSSFDPERMQSMRYVIRRLLKRPVCTLETWPPTDYELALTWFGLDHLSAGYRGLSTKPNVQPNRSVSLYVTPQSDAPAELAILRKHIDPEKLNSRIHTVFRLLTQSAEVGAEPLSNRIFSKPQMNVLAESGRGDFVVMGCGFGYSPDRTPLPPQDFLRLLHRNIRQAWSRGARLLLVRRPRDTDVIRQLRSWGLRVSPQSAPGYASAGFVSAVNFDTEDSARPLLPLPGPSAPLA